MLNIELKEPLNKIIRLNKDGSFKVLLIDGCLSELKPHQAIELNHHHFHLKKEPGSKEIFLSFKEEHLLLRFEDGWKVSGNIEIFTEALKKFKLPDGLPENFKMTLIIK